MKIKEKSGEKKDKKRLNAFFSSGYTFSNRIESDDLLKKSENDEDNNYNLYNNGNNMENVENDSNIENVDNIVDSGSNIYSNNTRNSKFETGLDLKSENSSNVNKFFNRRKKKIDLDEIKEEKEEKEILRNNLISSSDKFSESKNGKKKIKSNYFGNPPPKKEKEKEGKSVDEKNERKKEGNKNLKFFTSQEDSENLNYPKVPRKKTNIFNEEYYDVYEPKFSKDKKIGEKDKFYFETVKEDEDMNILTTIGMQQGERRKKENEKIQRNAEIRVGKNFNANALSLENKDAVDLPELPLLTYENRLQEYYDVSLPFCDFLKRNLKHRFLPFSLFSNFSIFYSRIQRIAVYVTQMSINAAFVSIFLTSDEECVVLSKERKNRTDKFFLYVFISAVLSCLYTNIETYFGYINLEEMRKLYIWIRDDRGINILKATSDLKKSQKLRRIIQLILHIFSFIVSFYISFGFCATYKYQEKTFLIAIIIIPIFDIIVLEPLYEVLLAVVYLLRKKGRIFVIIGEILGRIRNAKTMFI